jgi:hypothetical protein
MNKSQFISELAKLRPSSTFLALMGYRNKFSEVADYSIVFHMNYKNSLEKSILILEGVVPDTDLQAVAKRELIDGYTTSLNKVSETSIEEIDDAYTRFFDSNNKYIKGVKMHTASGNLHLYGFLVHKRIIMPGTYPVSKKRALTIAKDKLRKLVPVNRFRQFIVEPDRVDHISVAHMTLLPPYN